jgi:hypothetical protein
MVSLSFTSYPFKLYSNQNRINRIFKEEIIVLATGVLSPIRNHKDTSQGPSRSGESISYMIIQLNIPNNLFQPPQKKKTSSIPKPLEDHL